MNTSQFVIAIVSILSALVGAFISEYLTKKLFSKKKFTPENAIELLKAGCPEEWNEVRILNPEWSPDLHGADLSHSVLPSANFQNANLDNALFNHAVLDGCDFYEASLKFTSFEDASLIGARFDSANLENTNLKGALLDEASFDGATLVETQIPKGAELASADVTSIDHRDLSNVLLQDPATLDRMNPWQFENFVSSVFKSAGYKVFHNLRGRDQGFDFMIVRSDPIKGQERYFVECKKYSPGRLVGVSPVRALYAKSIENNADHAVLVTSSGFTREALEIAKQMRGVELVDRQALSRMVVNAFNPQL